MILPWSQSSSWCPRPILLPPLVRVRSPARAPSSVPALRAIFRPLDLPAAAARLEGGDLGPRHPRQPSSAQEQGPIWIWHLLYVVTSGLPMVLSSNILTGPALPSPLPSPPLAPECVLGGMGGGAGPCSVRDVGMGAGPSASCCSSPWGSGGDFPGHPHSPREGEGALVSHRPGAGARG